MNISKRRMTACLLAACMVLALPGIVFAEEVPPPGVPTLPPGEAVDQEVTHAAAGGGLQPGTTITVGTPTAMRGHFGLEMWSENTSDIDVRTLLSGYSIVSRNSIDGYFFDPLVVSTMRTVDGADGSKTFELSLASNLMYNDGTPITAADYAFSLLLGGSMAVRELGGRPGNWGHIEGYADYLLGETKAISGIRILSERSLSITIAADSWPLFYGMAMLAIYPLPIESIAPGCSVRDDGQGAYIDGSLDTILLLQTVMDTNSGYLMYPRVTSGPYMFESYDREAGRATFIANERYLGNADGLKPRIERIVFEYVDAETMMEALAAGDIDIINKVTAPDAVETGQAMVAAGAAQESSYLRDGLAFLAFCGATAPTDSQAVRKAVTMALDRDAFVETAGGVSARRVYGYYGLGQWMTTYEMQNADGAGVRVSEVLPQLDIPYDPEGAAALLESDGWTLNAAGEAYIAADGAIRYKQTEDGLIPLNISWAKTEGSTMADALETAMLSAFAKAGIGLSVTEMPFEQVLEQYEGDGQGAYNLYFLGNNFMDVFDPYHNFSMSADYHIASASNGVDDAALMRLSEQMRTTPAEDTDLYIGRWLQFQIRFMEVLPAMPLYSNIYFDFAGNRVMGYDIENHASWAEAILCTSIDE